MTDPSTSEPEYFVPRRTDPAWLRLILDRARAWYARRAVNRAPAPERPTITIDPAMRFGRPHIRGISTQAIAGLVISGDGVDAAMDDFGLTRHEVLLACWHEGLQGEYQREWGKWANAVHAPLGGWEPLDVDALPDPPERAA